jgi:bifunctional non-homologous end joining protein LigD
MPRKTTTTRGRGAQPPSRATPHVRTGPSKPPRSARRPAKSGATPAAKAAAKAGVGAGASAASTRGGSPRKSNRPGASKPAPKKVIRRPAKAAVRQAGTPPDVEAQLRAIEASDGDGELELGHDQRLHVSSLGKVYFPETGATKGAVMRYYARMSRFILPDIDGRPLILQRYPEGVGGEMFFQQDAGPHVPDVVRVESVNTADKGEQDRIVGGDLATLLYTVQLGAIEVHPWFSQVGDIDAADRCLIDLDPGEGVPFAWVVELAQEIVRIARECELPVAVKTSGSRGIHLVFPLPAHTTFESSLALAQLVARAAAIARPDLATVERSIRSRPERSIYVDALQNARGKSMAGAYSLRATATATASAPLRPRELTPRLKLTGFTIGTMPQRTERIGDIWRETLAGRPTARALARALQGLEATLAADVPRRGTGRR